MNSSLEFDAFKEILMATSQDKLKSNQTKFGYKFVIINIITLSALKAQQQSHRIEYSFL